MDAAECDHWLDHHCAAFPSLRVWLSDQPGETLLAWRRALGDVRLEDAKAATDGMLSGDEERPRGWSEHPAAVRRIARRFAARVDNRRPERTTRYIDGVPVYECSLCCDSGLVLVWHPESMRAVRDRQPLPQLTRTCDAACTCDAGDRWANPPRGVRRLLRYRSPPMIRCTDDMRVGDLLDALGISRDVKRRRRS